MQYLPFDATKLDPLARELARRLFSWKPDWAKYAQIAQAYENQPWEFYLVVPNHVRDEERSLQIYTDQGEVTLGFSDWHSHFVVEGEQEATVKGAIDAIERVVSDQVFILSAKGPGRRWQVSLESELTEESLLSLLTEPGLEGKLRLISFTGSLDDEINLKEVQREGAGIFLKRRGRAV